MKFVSANPLLQISGINYLVTVRFQERNSSQSIVMFSDMLCKMLVSALLAIDNSPVVPELSGYLFKPRHLWAEHAAELE